MYHALVRLGGTWASHGLHTSFGRWSTIYQELKEEFGSENTACVFWPPSDELGTVDEVGRRMQDDALLANDAQERWDAGSLPGSADDDGKLHLSHAIDQLRRARLSKQAAPTG